MLCFCIDSAECFHIKKKKKKKEKRMLLDLQVDGGEEFYPLPQN